MPITCPRCLRSLSSAEADGPPAFCMYCGQKLRESTSESPPGEMRTTSFVPFSDAAEEDEEPPPQAIGGYRLIRRIGAGGMGTVYEAETADSSQRVAVKVLSSRLASSPTSVERFRQEGRLASQLVHPRCVFVVTADTDAGRPYIVMELMPGRTLKDVVDKAGAIEPAEAIAYILDVIDGLAEAHRLGVLHRDVKPSNCFLTADGRVKIGDFGLSKSLAGSQDQQLTQTGAFLGTVLFASPEQIRGEPLDYASDVYSVCATLYYILCGEAPYQHESVTAALAKAISEPPPPICDRRPAVPRALERIVVRGLERDRERRWQSLADLRDALAELVPARQTPARPRALVGAFLVDWLVLVLITILPLEILRSLFGWRHVGVAGLTLDPVAWAIAVAYFATLEGLLGQTIGKALLGLRVSRVGETGPPGLARGWLRAFVFIALWLVVLLAAPVIGRLASRVAGAGVLFLGIAALLIQLRRTSGGYRGLHDFASGCHVTQRPFPTRKLRLVPHGPNPLDDALPGEPERPLPEMVGSFAVTGRLRYAASGEEVWIAEDRVLGRRILVWLRPADRGSIPPGPAETVRPTRLRRLGSGSLAWSGKDWSWAAFAAPVGMPLAETIAPDRPLPWADARILLEQLTDELQASEIDGSTPAELGIDQVWVEAGGRVQLLDVPVGNRPGESSPIALLRDVAALTLEGHIGPHCKAGIAAPVPPHAAPILNKLFSTNGYTNLAELHRDLLDTHAHAPEVTASLRTAQLGIQAGFLSLGLVAMFVASGVVSVMLVKLAEIRAGTAERIHSMLRDPDRRDRLKKMTDMGDEIARPSVVARIERLMTEKRREARYRRELLLGPERLALEEFDRALNLRQDRAELNPRAVRELLAWATAAEHSKVGRSPSPWDPEAGPVWTILILFPLLWVSAAALLRGGISMLLAGIALVRADGRRAARRQCALRAAIVWFPIAFLLFTSVWLQVYRPDYAYLYISLWFVALALLPVYVVIALRYPSRPPQDRIAGTYLVPA